MTQTISKEEARQLFEAHSALVFRMALLLTRSRTLADDVVQETFIRIFQKYHLYDPAKPIQPWICQIAMNVTRNLLRKNRWQVLTHLFPNTSDPFSAEEIVVQTETQKELWQLLQKLPQKSREVLVLRYYAELPLQEIAVILDIPLGTCKSRIHTALGLLRKKTENGVLQQIIKGGEM